MSKETVRLRGGDTGRSDIIRSLKNIPDQKEFFRDVYKINKELNKNNIKISFGPDGKALLNTAEPFKPSELRAQLKQNAPASVFANIPENPEVNYVNVKSELNLIPNNIDSKTFVEAIGAIQAVYHVLNSDDLRSSIINFLETLTVRGFNIFMTFVKTFVAQYGDDIQRRTQRFIPFESFLNDIFKILYEIAEETGINDFIEEQLIQNEQMIYIAINEFYNQFRPQGDRTGTCKLCGGTFYVDSDN